MQQTHLTNYLLNNALYHSFQSAYREWRSTETALIWLTELNMAIYLGVELLY